MAGGTGTVEAEPRNFELIERDGLETSLLEVSMGPHHPSTHGVFRMDV